MRSGLIVALEDTGRASKYGHIGNVSVRGVEKLSTNLQL